MAGRMITGLVALVLGASFAGPVPAQTPPSAAQIAAYTGLHAAAAEGDIAEIERLSRSGEDLNAADRNARTPLHVAAFQGQAASTAALLQAGADPDRLDAQRYDAVTIAAVQDDLDTLRALLAGGASAKLVTSVYDGTALIAAAHLGHADAVRELIKAGAPLDHVNNLGWTALIEAVVLGDGGRRHADTVRALIEAGARTDLGDRDGRTPLDHARGKGYAEMVRMLEGPTGR